MKVLQINCVYPTGSTGKIMHEIHKGLCAQGEESVICYGRGTNVKQPNVYKTCSELSAKFYNGVSRFTGLPYGGCRISTNRLLSIIKKEQPDIVHLHCINGYFVNIYRLIQWLKDNHVKTVVTNHAEFYYTANCGHAYDCQRWMYGCGNCPALKRATKSLLWDKTAVSYRKMQQAFSGFGDDLLVVSVSPWVEQRAKQSKIFEGLRHCTIFNGVDIDTFRIWPRENVYQRASTDTHKIVFHATAHFTDQPGNIKGGAALIELAKRMQHLPIRFYVAAGKTDISTTLPENMVLLGRISDQKMLAKYYGEADLTVITSIRETFSMPCAESLCCGTPVVGFQAGAPEQIALKEYSEFVDQGDLEQLEAVIVKWLDSPIDKKTISDKAVNVYANEQMVQSYRTMYGALV